MSGKKLLALAWITALTGCGGGGAAPAPPPAVTASTSAAATPVAKGTLTLKFPAGFHTAKHPAATRSGRRPAYVNPGSFYLDVWVLGGGSPQHVVDSSAGANIQNNAQNTQTYTVPLFSTTSSQIVAYETDAPFNSGGNLLAIGEADIGSITAGSAPALSLTMQMNAHYIGVMNDPNDLNGDAAVGRLYANTASACSPGAGSGSLYFFTTDTSGGFYDVAGVGGTILPTLKSATSDVTAPTNTFAQAGGAAPYYTATFNNLNGGVTVTLTAQNPAYAITNGAASYDGSYPGVQTMLGGYDQTLSADVYNAPATIANTIDLLPNCAIVLSLNSNLISIPNGYDTATSAPATSASFPVLFYNGYTYWPFSDYNNDVSFYLGKYDSSFNFISVTGFGGDRYVSSAVVAGGYVTFYGQYYLSNLGPGVQISLGSLP